MKYPELTGICAKLIKEGKCLGCNKLEDINFKGQEVCKYQQKEYYQLKIKE